MPSTAALAQSIAVYALTCACAMLAFRAAAWFFRNRPAPAFRGGKEPFALGRAVKIALWATPVLTAISMGLFFLVKFVAEWCGCDLPEQDIARLLKDPAVPSATKGLLVGTALVLAPALEEGVFRRCLFRALLRWMNPYFAMAASGCAFAAVHFNLAGFLPLWYLGAGFASLYFRTGRLAAPIVAHTGFNLANLLLLCIE